MDPNALFDVRTYVKFAVGRLRDRYPTWISLEDLVAFTLNKNHTDDDKTRFRVFLAANPKVIVDEKSNTYRFRPHRDIASAEDLLRYLRTQAAAAGLRVAELKEAWPDAEQAITELEKQHKLIVTRNKKDGNARSVWLNDPVMYARVDDEFRDIWQQISLPPTEQLREELKQTGFKVATEAPKVVAPARVEKKKKKGRRGQKITNTHMAGLFKDYSHQRPAAAK